jgi:hypothetical protein
MAHYQPRHTSHEVVGSSPRPRRSRVVVASLVGAVIVAAAVVIPLMASGGGSGTPTTTAQAAAPTTTAGGSAPTTNDAATTGPAGTGPTSTGSTNTGDHVATLGAGSAGTSATTTAPRVVTTTTLPRLNPADATSPATNTAAPTGLGLVFENLWVDAHPGGVPMTGADVASTLDGSVFYADQPAIGTSWAISRFVPSAHAQAMAGTTAGRALLAQFNDTAIFVKVPGKSWAYLGEYTTTACGQSIPVPVLTSWGMCG